MLNFYKKLSITLFYLVSILLFAISSAAPKYFTQKSLGELVPGKENQEVRNLQQALYDFGYYKVEEDDPTFSGKFESDLHVALKDFQETNDLRVSGRADFATLKVINEFIKFQNDSEADGEVSKEKLDSDGYLVEEKNYFQDISDGEDVGQKYGGPNFEKQFGNEEIAAKSGESVKSPGIINKIFNSILDFFTPSEKYRDAKRSALDMESQKPVSRFENYDYFECIADDECIEYMRSKDVGQK